MNSLAQLWQEEYGVEHSLEVDSWFRRLVNTHLVARFMNAFPHAAIRLFTRSKGELARLLFVEREGGSYRVLRSMYRFEEPHERGDLINRLLMQSPAIKAARNRRRIAQRMLHVALSSMRPGLPRLVMAIGGGDGSQEIEVLARIRRETDNTQDVYYCGVDRDERAVAENQAVLARHGLEDRGFTFTGSVATRGDIDTVLEKASERFGVAFNGVSVTLCQGLIEYLDMHSHSNDTLGAMLDALNDGTLEDGALILSQTDFHDRVRFLEEGLEWYMRLRSSAEVAAELEKHGWNLCVCEREPMKLITMCLATKSDVRSQWRLDDQSPLHRPHITRAGSPVPPPAKPR